MENEQLEDIKSKFSKYVRSFRYRIPDWKKTIGLKEIHSWKVSKEIVAIGKSIELNHKGLNLAEAIGLLHDIGRFKQFEQYRTFADSRSVNHGEFGSNILQQENILDCIDADEKQTVFDAVRFHNSHILPNGLAQQSNLFLSLLRDADKLDIYRVVTEHYKSRDSKSNVTIELELDDNDHISDSAINCIFSHKSFRYNELQSLNDFKLLQLSWVFDINFSKTAQLIAEREYLQMIRETLPENTRIESVFSYICSIIKSKSQVEPDLNIA